MGIVACRPGVDAEPQPPDETGDRAADARAAEPPLAPPPALLVPLHRPTDDASDTTVSLPPSPNFSTTKIPETYDDGAYSVAGLRRHRDERFEEGNRGEEVTVRAYVVEVYVPPVCPTGTMCPRPKQPHVRVADRPDEPGRKRAMLVANYAFTIPEWEAQRWKREPTVRLTKGKRYTFRGRFKQISDTGFVDHAGLLEFVAYRPLDRRTGRERRTWVYPPGAPWHPKELARQQEQNQRLLEAAERSAR